MLKVKTLRHLIHAITVLIDAAVRSGFKRSKLTLAIVFSFVSMRAVGRNVGCSHQSVARIAGRVLMLKLPLPKFDDLGRQELLLIFYPKYQTRESIKRAVPFDVLAKETSIRPKKHGLTRFAIWLDYFKVDPRTAYSYAHFCRLWREYSKNTRLEMRRVHKPGEVMMCDFAGINGFYSDKRTGKKIKLYLFVAVLPYSNLLFAYFTPDLTAKSWCRAIAKAFHYFGGVPAVIQFDNAALVNKAGLLEEFNEQASELSRYYDTFCLAIRPGSPRDNGPAEKAVQFIQSRVLVPLKRQTFFSADEAQSRLAEAFKPLNFEPMQKVKISRCELFNSKERIALNPITKHEYKPFDERFEQTASSGCTITYKTHEYSVPYQYRNKLLTMLVTGKSLQIFDEYIEIAKHQISEEVRGKTILFEHRHPNHQYEELKNQYEFVSWAETIDPSVVGIVRQQYKRMKSSHSRRAGNNCLALQKLCKKYGEETVAAACKFSIQEGIYSINQIIGIIESRIYEPNSEEVEDEMPAFLAVAHKNIRGKEHFQGGRNV